MKIIIAFISHSIYLHCWCIHYSFYSLIAILLICILHYFLMMPIMMENQHIKWEIVSLVIHLINHLNNIHQLPLKYSSQSRLHNPSPPNQNNSIHDCIITNTIQTNKHRYSMIFMISIPVRIANYNLKIPNR